MWRRFLRYGGWLVDKLYEEDDFVLNPPVYREPMKMWVCCWLSLGDEAEHHETEFCAQCTLQLMNVAGQSAMEECIGVVHWPPSLMHLRCNKNLSSWTFLRDTRLSLCNVYMTMTWEYFTSLGFGSEPFWLPLATARFWNNIPPQHVTSAPSLLVFRLHLNSSAPQLFLSPFPVPVPDHVHCLCSYTFILDTLIVC